MIARKIGAAFNSATPSITSVVERDLIYECAFRTRSSVVRAGLSKSSRTCLDTSSLRMVKVLASDESSETFA